MQLTGAQYERIARLLQVLNALLIHGRAGLQVARAAARFRTLHTVYVRLNRWGVPKRVWAQLLDGEPATAGLDGTIIKLQLGRRGSAEKGAPGDRPLAQGPDDCAAPADAR